MTRFAHLPEPWVLIAGVGAALTLIAVSHVFARGRASQGVRFVCALLRAVCVGLLTVCLLDPQWVRKISRQPQARLAVLLDSSRSMATDDVPGGRLEAGRTWIEEHVSKVAPSGLGLLQLGFHDRLFAVTNSPEAAGTATGLGRALESLLAQPSEDPLTGVVLVSDGIDTTGAALDTVARDYRRRGVPIHTFVTGTTNRMRDVALEQVQVRRAVPNEAPTRITVGLRSEGFRGTRGQVQIRRGTEILATQDLTFNGAGQNVTLDFTPRQKGFQIYEVSVGGVPGEWLASNNRRAFGLEVADPTIRVLYMEGTPQNQASPQPEWKYLKDALQSDSNIVVTTLYRQFGNNGQFLRTVDSDIETGERIFPVEHPTRGFPRTLDGLLKYDVVIHSDIRTDSFLEEQIENMARLVEEFGGGFVMIGGNSAFGRGGYHRTVLDRIIPVAMEGAYDSDRRDFRLKVPDNAWTHPLVALGRDPADTRRIWTERFPSLHGLNVMERVKPAATLLAITDDGLDNVVLAVQEIGRGRSMAFTSDTTRSWGEDFETLWGEPRDARRMLTEWNCDSRYYRRFWINAVRWLAAGKAGKTNQPVVVELDRGNAAPGDTVTASVRVRDQAQRDVAGAEVTLWLGRGTSSNAVATARYDAATRSHIARVKVPAEGQWILTGIASRNGSRLGDDRQLLVSETLDRELLDLAARPAVLERLARLSGGTAFAAQAQDGPNLKQLFAGMPPPITEYQREPLWDKAWWLGAVLGLLSVEWALRRWRGLA
jgi:uncharacterized membrane protein